MPTNSATQIRKTNRSIGSAIQRSFFMTKRSVAAYFNPINELVIKQRDTLGHEATIFIAPENVDSFLRGLNERALRNQLPRSSAWSMEDRPHEQAQR